MNTNTSIEIKDLPVVEAELTETETGKVHGGRSGAQIEPPAKGKF